MPTLRNVHRAYRTHSSAQVPTTSFEPTRHQNAESHCHEGEEGVWDTWSARRSGTQSSRTDTSARHARKGDYDPYTSSEGECEDDMEIEIGGSDEDENDIDEYVPTSPRRHRRTTRQIPSTSPIVPQNTSQTSKEPTITSNPATVTTSFQPSFSPPTSTKRGKNRPPGYVPRPPNAFIVFRSAFVGAGRLGRSLHLPSLSSFPASSDPRHTHGQNRTTSHQQELSKNAALAWNALSQEDRKPYQEEAIRRNEAQRREHPGWKYGRGAARVVKGSSKKRTVIANYRQARGVDANEYTCTEAKSLVQVVPVPPAADHVKTATRTTAKPFTQLSQTRANSGALPKAKPRAKAKSFLLERPPQGPKSKSRFFAGPNAKHGSAPAQPATSKTNRVRALHERSPVPTIKLSLRPPSPSVCAHDSASHSEDQSTLRLRSESKPKSFESTEQEEDLIPELTSIWWSTTLGSSAFLEANQRGFPEGLSASQIGSPSVDPLFPFTESNVIPSSTSDAPFSGSALETIAVTSKESKLNHAETSGQNPRQCSPPYTYPGPSPYPMTLTLPDSNLNESKWAGLSLTSLSSTHPSSQHLDTPFDPVAYSMSMTAASRLELSDWDFGMSMEVDDETCRGELSIEMHNWKDSFVLNPSASLPPSTLDPSSLPSNGSNWASPPSFPSFSSSPSCWISDFMALEGGE